MASGDLETEATWAPGGPRSHHATKASIAARLPSASISTEPSGRFLAHPDTSRRIASFCAEARNQTP